MTISLAPATDRRPPHRLGLLLLSHPCRACGHSISCPAVESIPQEDGVAAARPGTLVDVARQAGVSRSTASRVLSHSGYASQETRLRVLEAAKALGYRPNRVARSLRMQQTRTIGLLIEDVENSFYAAVARGVERRARDGGYQTVLGNTDGDPAQEKAYLKLFEETRVEGIIATPTGRENLALYRTLIEQGVALVQVDLRIEGFDADRVLIDNVVAARRAVEHLISYGHLKIGVLIDRPRFITVQERLQGYREALAAYGIPFRESLIRTVESRGAAGVRAALDLVHSDERPTAVFTTTNSTAAELVSALQQAGLTCPQDVSIVSFDDAPWMAFFPTPITAVQQPTVYMAQTAAALLLDRLAGDGPKRPTQITLAAELIERRSVTST